MNLLLALYTTLRMYLLIHHAKFISVLHPTPSFYTDGVANHLSMVICLKGEFHMQNAILCVDMIACKM